MQRILVNVTKDCDGNQLNYSNDLPAIGNKNYTVQKPFETDFLRVIGNAKLRRSIIHHLLNNLRQPTTLWPKASDIAL